ncbi:inhibin beta B chain-like [Latimeria chalumnae]
MTPLGFQPIMVLLIAILSASAQRMERSECLSCGAPRLEYGSKQELLIELAKQHILDKLHLDERPNITHLISKAALAAALRKLHVDKVRQDGTVDTARDLQSQHPSTEKEDYGYEIISFTESGQSNSSKTRLSFHFSKESGQNIQILQASLWLYLRFSENIQERVTIKMFLADRKGSKRTLIGEKDLELKWSSWQILPVTQTVQSFFDRGDKELHFELQCDGCRDESIFTDSRESHQPFLVAKARLKEDAHHLQKRSINCDKKSNFCCKKDFYVDFKDIGWNDWIVKPEGYHMNYCVGLCPLHIAGTPGIAASFHTAVFNLIKANNIHTAVNSCCIPTKKRPLSMLYFDRNNNIVKTDIPDMIVETCGCT